MLKKIKFYFFEIILFIFLSCSFFMFDYFKEFYIEKTNDIKIVGQFDKVIKKLNLEELKIKKYFDIDNEFEGYIIELTDNEISNLDKRKERVSEFLNNIDHDFVYDTYSYKHNGVNLLLYKKESGYYERRNGDPEYLYYIYKLNSRFYSNNMDKIKITHFKSSYEINQEGWLYETKKTYHDLNKDNKPIDVSDISYKFNHISSVQSVQAYQDMKRYNSFTTASFFLLFVLIFIKRYYLKYGSQGIIRKLKHNSFKKENEKNKRIKDNEIILKKLIKDENSTKTNKNINIKNY